MKLSYAPCSCFQDVFLFYFSKMLAKRLINETSASEDLEVREESSNDSLNLNQTCSLSRRQ